MSNQWHYSLLVEPTKNLSTAGIRQIVRLVGSRGYSVLNPVTRIVSCMRLGGMQELVSNDLDMALEILASEGGLLVFWKGDVNIQLTFDHAGEQAAISMSALQLPDTPTFGTISVSLDSHYLRYKQSPKESLAVASDVLWIFEQLCSFEDTVYGYSADEYAFEALIDRASIQRDVREEKLPSVLFWLQYFGADYVAQSGLEAFVKLGAKFQNLPNGVAISFFDYPWEVDIERLLALNSRWSEQRR
jgi:hypothetical protein